MTIFIIKSAGSLWKSDILIEKTPNITAKLIVLLPKYKQIDCFCRDLILKFVLNDFAHLFFSIASLFDGTATRKYVLGAGHA